MEQKDNGSAEESVLDLLRLLSGDDGQIVRHQRADAIFGHIRYCKELVGRADEAKNNRLQE